VAVFFHKESLLYLRNTNNQKKLDETIDKE